MQHLDGVDYEVVCICGSRKFKNLELVMDYVCKLAGTNVIILTGGARGPDLVALHAAFKFGLNFYRMDAEWDKYGLRAGPIRNSKLLVEADRVVAFWDGHSRGTLDMINKTKAANKPLEIIGE